MVGLEQAFAAAQVKSTPPRRSQQEVINRAPGWRNPAPVRDLPFIHMSKPEITAYVKTQCGLEQWRVRAVLKKYDLSLHRRSDIIQNPAFRWEMEQKSGQPLSPCVEVNGTMVADISGEELEQYLLQQGLVGAPTAPTNVPLNAPCSDAEHDAMARGIPLKVQV